MIPLIDDHLPAIRDAVRSKGAVVVVAPPGAGNTRVPPVLAQDGPLIVLQPRRVAARCLARRIAEEQGWTLGEEVGWQVRFERRFSRRTLLLLATEGILTARLQADPLLSDFRTVILDEFHERSLHADLALALVKQAARARGDLRVVVMSATLDAQAVARFLGGCPIIQVSGRLHPWRSPSTRCPSPRPRASWPRGPPDTCSAFSPAPPRFAVPVRSWQA